MKVGSTYSGFLLKEEKYIDEVKSVARIFEHEKTGARLLHLENDDDNKVFSISFRTPPYDDTGIPHILEHSVLSGTKRYPIKDIFMELAKTSLNTFINAMTYPDRTVYPVASRNKEDFFNLMSVYLDSVFYPNVLSEENIFLQEGWHYHLEKKKEKIRLNGVVYNEMKGAYSSPERLLYDKNIFSLYSDTVYGYDSGGDPDSIPELDYKKLLDFHRTYYHPSNSYIYIYGDGDIKKYLDFINKEYLGNFKEKKVNIDIGKQKPFKELKKLDFKYSISKQDKVENKAYLSLNYGMNKALPKEEYFALTVIVHYLVKTKSAPLKKVLLDAGIGEEVFGHFEGGLAYPYVSFSVKNTSLGKQRKFLEIVEKFLEQLAQNGFKKDLLEGCINTYEFLVREADYDRYPKGLVYNMQINESLLYGKDPFMFLEYEDSFKKLRDFVEKGSFEKLVKKYFLKNTHRSLVVLSPKQGLIDVKERELEKKLESFKKTLSNHQIDKIVQKTLNLEKYQITPDSSEDLKRVPRLKRSDLNTKQENIPLRKKRLGNSLILYNPVFTNNICYLNFAFDSSVVPQKKLHSLGILRLLLGKVDTEKYSYKELDVLIQKYTGGCHFRRGNFVFKGNDSEYLPKFLVGGKVFYEKLPKLMEILFEIMVASKFDDKKRIKTLIQESKSRIEADISVSGDDYASKRLFSYFSDSGEYDEYTTGITYFHFLSDLLKDFDEKWFGLKEDLECLQKHLFSSSGLLINVVSDEEKYSDIVNRVGEVVSKLAVGKLAKQKYSFRLGFLNEGLLSQNSVQFVAQGGNFKKFGFEYGGKLLVLKGILQNDYLWERVRLQGGAYGVHCSFSRGGNVLLSSYRDPNLLNTLEVYKEIPSFIESFETDDMDKYIIGTIGSLDKPLTPSMKGEKSLSMYISGISDKDLQKERNEVLSTTQKDIRGFSELLRASLKKKYYCVLGNEGNIKAQKKLFEKLVLVNK